MNIQHLSIREIKDKIQQSSLEELEDLLNIIELDHRKGVQTLHRTILNKCKAERDNLNKKEMLLKLEGKLWSQGYQRIGGIDEAGRGPLAGPVVAACVVFPPGLYIEGVNDSKRLSSSQRDDLYDVIMEKALAVGVGCVDHNRIDEINILNATREAMMQAVIQCIPSPDYLLIDALKLDLPIISMSFEKGEQFSHSIAAASIIAKVTRDREMLKWHNKYPDYGFHKHKGYGTALHMDSIIELGACPIHRRTFIQNVINKNRVGT